jgi:endonuclease/exonuclease/phosphatase family metal-dependent hydrolase
MFKTLVHIFIVLVGIGVGLFFLLVCLFKFWHRVVALPPARSLILKKLPKIHSRPACSSTVRLLSCNLFMLPGPFVRHSWSDSKEERLKDFCRLYLPSFDIVCLQECFSTFSSRYHTLVKEAMAHGHHYIVWPEAPSWVSPELFDSGTTILSRYPVLARGWDPFPCSTWPNVFASSGLQWALIDLGPRGLLNVFNLHLQSYLTLRASPLALLSQDAQLRTIWSAVTRRAHPEAPAIVCGDWNIDLAHAPNRKFIWKHVPPKFSLAIPHYPSVPISTHRAFYKGDHEVATLKAKVSPEDRRVLKEIPQWLDHIFYRNLVIKDASIHSFELTSYPYRCSDHDGVSLTF